MMAQQQQQQQQQQYVQYAAQPAGPGATVYTYPGAQQPQMMVVQPGAAGATAVQNKFDPSGSRAAVVLGAIQFIIGCCCIIFQSVSTHLESSLSRVNYTAEFLGTGIWCGILFLLTGAFGLGAGKRNTAGLIITFMVMNILSSLAIWTLLSFAAMNLAMVRQCQQYGVLTFSVYEVPQTCNEDRYSVWVAMDAFLVTLAIVEFIIAVTSAAYCCKAVCYCCRSNAGMILHPPPQSGVYVATTAQLPSQQQQQQYQQYQQHQAMGSKPYPVQGSYMQYPAGGAAGTVSYGQASYAQPGQPQFQQQQQQQVPLLSDYTQATYNPYPTSSTIPAAAGQSGAAYPGQAYYPPSAGDNKPAASAPELPPSYDAAQKL